MSSGSVVIPYAWKVSFKVSTEIYGETWSEVTLRPHLVTGAVMIHFLHIPSQLRFKALYFREKITQISLRTDKGFFFISKFETAMGRLDYLMYLFFLYPVIEAVSKDLTESQNISNVFCLMKRIYFHI